MQTIQQAVAAAVDYCNDESCGDTELSFLASYSGRGMYGQTCIGVVGSKSVILEMIAYIISDAHSNHVLAIQNSAAFAGTAREEEALEKEREASNFAENVVRELLSFSQDSMGRDDCIIYWENLEAE